MWEIRVNVRVKNHPLDRFVYSNIRIHPLSDITHTVDRHSELVHNRYVVHVDNFGEARSIVAPPQLTLLGAHQ